MKIRGGTEREEIKLQMTSMIDIVFLLLIFFIMTFKIVSQEGDFNIKMPLAAPQDALPSDDDFLPLKIRLVADASGKLASITLNDQPFTSFDELNRYIIGFVGDDRGPGSARETAEVELDCDFDLDYENVIAAITAISGYVDEESGEIVKLIENIKFAAPRGESS